MNMGPELGNSPLGGWPELVNASHDLKSQGAFSQLIVDGATLQRKSREASCNASWIQARAKQPCRLAHGVFVSKRA